jgi:excisionase family DNA binding protein
MSIPEIAELINQSERQVWRYVKDGRLEVIRLGGAVRVTPEAVARLLGLL